MPMRLFLCRHAKASPGEPDAARELTAEGHEQARALGVLLAAHDDAPALVLSSPLVRARQTAQAIAHATGAPLRIEERLAPGATAAALVAALAGEPGPIATVGHQPDCSEIAVALTGSDPGFPAAGMTEIELTP
jgi:phosphohistidine phosphatase